MAKLFSKVMVPFCIATGNVWKSHLLHLLTNVWYCQSFNLQSFFVGKKWVTHGCFNLQFLWDRWCCNLIYCACWPFVYFLLWSDQILCRFFIGLFVFVLLSCKSLYIHISAYVFSQIYVLKIFFPNLWLTFLYT